MKDRVFATYEAQKYSRPSPTRLVINIVGSWALSHMGSTYKDPETVANLLTGLTGLKGARSRFPQHGSPVIYHLSQRSAKVVVSSSCNDVISGGCQKCTPARIESS